MGRMLLKGICPPISASRDGLRRILTFAASRVANEHEPSGGIVGRLQPPTVPATLGQVSWLSGKPSPSESVLVLPRVSASGQPVFHAGPPVSGQRSTVSAVPSPSLSSNVDCGSSGTAVGRGQPFRPGIVLRGPR